MRGRASVVLALAALAASALSTGAAAAATALVHPPDMALLEGPGALEVRGWNPGAAAPVTVKNAAGSREYPGATGAFTLQVALVPGVNTIHLGERTARVFLAAQGEKAPSTFSAPDPHAADNACDDCHAIDGGAIALQEPAPALCARCHDDMLKDRTGKRHAVQHPPAEEGDCLSCHAFHQRSIKGLPAEAKRALCFGCHDDFAAGRKRLHAPVAAGDCTGCHGAHGGALKALLPAAGLKLCLLCHADPAKKKDGGDWALGHPALDEGCASCHQHHAADGPGLLRKPQREICADCHDPFPAEADGRPLTVHNPVEEGECAGCHAVHGSDVKKLLAAGGKQLCEKCHTDPSTNGGADWAVPHPALDDGCLACHLPHVAPAAGMLRKDQAPLCFDCHDAFAAPEAGGSAHRPVAEGRCARCHAPHGAAEAKLLLARPGKALCLGCHQDPAVTPKGEEWRVPHPALDDGCPTCHQPHVAAAPRLLAKPQGELCAGCHEDKNLNGDGVEWATPHQPVRSGLCGACHGVHGAPEKGLLKLVPLELCTASCHTEVHANHRSTEINPETSQPVSPLVRLPAGFPIRRKDGALACVGCHQPHGSDNQDLWNKEQQAFCVQCHQF